MDSYRNTLICKDKLSGLGFGIEGIRGFEEHRGFGGLRSCGGLCTSEVLHHVDNVHVAMSTSNVQRRLSIVVPLLRIGSSLKKKLGNISVTRPSDNVQRCPGECSTVSVLVLALKFSI